MHFQRLRDLREDSDRTQQDVADYLHMKREVYRRYEVGEREIPVWAVIRPGPAVSYLHRLYSGSDG